MQYLHTSKQGTFSTKWKDVETIFSVQPALQPTAYNIPQTHLLAPVPEQVPEQRQVGRKSGGWEGGCVQVGRLVTLPASCAPFTH